MSIFASFNCSSWRRGCCRGQRLVGHRLERYVKELKGGKLKIDKAKVAQDEKLDGKYLLSTSDQHMSAEDS